MFCSLCTKNSTCMPIKKKTRHVSFWRVLFFSFQKQYFCPQKLQRHAFRREIVHNAYQASRRYLNILRVWTTKTLTVNIWKGTIWYKQWRKGNTGLNHKALEISISSKAISYSQGDPKGNTLVLSFLLLPVLRMGRKHANLTGTSQTKVKIRDKTLKDSNTPVTGLIKPFNNYRRAGNNINLRKFSVDLTMKG